jgi:translation initiation factor IF-3
VPIKEALLAAKEKNLDLVEVAPDTEQPVCRIMDYGKRRYDKQKKTKGKPKKAQHLKEIKLRPLTQEHDIEVKVRSMKKFLTQGDKVKISMIFRGRERSHTDLGLKLLNDIAEKIEETGVVEVSPKVEGRDLFMLIVPK